MLITATRRFPLAFLLLGCLLHVCQVHSKVDGAGPWVLASEGEPWPIPASRQLYDGYFKLQPDDFSFQIENKKCDILENAIARYKKIIVDESHLVEKLALYRDAQSNNDDNVVYTGYITGIKINLLNDCMDYPHLKMNESYEILVPDLIESNKVALKSETIWGILRGLETFSQLIVTSTNGLSIKQQKIVDYPRLSHRGLLLDTGRHYLPVSDILNILEAMSYNKLNVFHWHIVDDNSFPYQSDRYPELSRKGAYHPSMIYNSVDIKLIVEFARLRGIRVIPEFDTPGHTMSWGLSHPEYLTTCYGADGQPNDILGPINPTKRDFYTFLLNLFTEIKGLFPDAYFHLGGDEVNHNCWKSNPQINNFMKHHNMSHNYKKLEALHYMEVMRDFGNKMKPIVWQEVYDNDVPLTNHTVVQIWTGDWKEKISMVTSSDLQAILSTCWYLDHVAGGTDWLKYYRCDPLDFEETFPGQKKLVVGGEACMWGEFVDRNNIHSRIWPRASAAAEKLWSVRTEDIIRVNQRLEEHACRMNRRGIPAQPANGPGFCITLDS